MLLNAIVIGWTGLDPLLWGKLAPRPPKLAEAIDPNEKNHESAEKAASIPVFQVLPASRGEHRANRDELYPEQQKYLERTVNF
jgi:hypothetical protein